MYSTELRSCRYNPNQVFPRPLIYLAVLWLTISYVLLYKIANHHYTIEWEGRDVYSNFDVQNSDFLGIPLYRDRRCTAIVAFQITMGKRYFIINVLSPWPVVFCIIIAGVPAVVVVAPIIGKSLRYAAQTASRSREIQPALGRHFPSRGTSDPNMAGEPIVLEYALPDTENRGCISMQWVIVLLIWVIAFIAFVVRQIVITPSMFD